MYIEGENEGCSSNGDTVSAQQSNYSVVNRNGQSGEGAVVGKFDDSKSPNGNTRNGNQDKDYLSDDIGSASARPDDVTVSGPYGGTSFDNLLLMSLRLKNLENMSSPESKLPDKVTDALKALGDPEWIFGHREEMRNHFADNVLEIAYRCHNSVKFEFGKVIQFISEEKSDDEIRGVIRDLYNKVSPIFIEAKNRLAIAQFLTDIQNKIEAFENELGSSSGISGYALNEFFGELKVISNVHSQFIAQADITDPELSEIFKTVNGGIDSSMRVLASFQASLGLDGKSGIDFITFQKDEIKPLIDSKNVLLKTVAKAFDQLKGVGQSSDVSGKTSQQSPRSFNSTDGDQQEKHKLVFARFLTDIQNLINTSDVKVTEISSDGLHKFVEELIALRNTYLENNITDPELSEIFKTVNSGIENSIESAHSIITELDFMGENIENIIEELNKIQQYNDSRITLSKTIKKAFDKLQGVGQSSDVSGKTSQQNKNIVIKLLDGIKDQFIKARKGLDEIREEGDTGISKKMGNNFENFQNDVRQAWNNFGGFFNKYIDKIRQNPKSKSDPLKEENNSTFIDEESEPLIIKATKDGLEKVNQGILRVDLPPKEGLQSTDGSPQEQSQVPSKSVLENMKGILDDMITKIGALKDWAKEKANIKSKGNFDKDLKPMIDESLATLEELQNNKDLSVEQFEESLEILKSITQNFDKEFIQKVEHGEFLRVIGHRLCRDLVVMFYNASFVCNEQNKEELILKLEEKIKAAASKAYREYTWVQEMVETKPKGNFEDLSPMISWSLDTLEQLLNDEKLSQEEVKESLYGLYDTVNFVKLHARSNIKDSKFLEISDNLHDSVLQAISDNGKCKFRSYKDIDISDMRGMIRDMKREIHLAQDKAFDEYNAYSKSKVNAKGKASQQEVSSSLEQGKDKSTSEGVVRDFEGDYVGGKEATTSSNAFERVKNFGKKVMAKAGKSENVSRSGDSVQTPLANEKKSEPQQSGGSSKSSSADTKIRNAKADPAVESANKGRGGAA